MTAVLYPRQKPVEVRIMTSQQNDVIIRTLRASAGGKAAEKFPVTHHFVI